MQTQCCRHTQQERPNGQQHYSRASEHTHKSIGLMSGCKCADTAETKSACIRTRKAQHSKCPPRKEMHGGRNVVWIVSVVAWAVSITQRARRHRGPDRLCEMEGKGYGMRDCAWRYRHRSTQPAYMPQQGPPATHALQESWPLLDQGPEERHGGQSLNAERRKN